MGGEAFCFKVCDPAGPDAAHYCEHIYDRIGCAYNAPNNAQNGTFEACLGDSQDFPGVYTSDGQGTFSMPLLPYKRIPTYLVYDAVVTYTQPAESLGAITTIPYTPNVPASSSCTTFQSAELYASAASWWNENVSSVSGVASAGSGSGSGASATRTSGASDSTSSSDASGAIGAHAALAGNGAGAGAAIAFMGMLAAAMIIM